MKALILWWDNAQWPLAREALRAAGRSDLIGRGATQLVPPPGHDQAPPRNSAPPRGPARKRPQPAPRRARG
jgi:hypothetical protein